MACSMIIASPHTVLAVRRGFGGLSKEETSPRSRTGIPTLLKPLGLAKDKDSLHVPCQLPAAPAMLQEASTALSFHECSWRSWSSQPPLSLHTLQLPKA